MRHLTTKFFTKFWKSTRGSAAAEYGILIALIVVVLLGTISALGTSANTAFSKTAVSLAN
jgi:pilus assembly protein Flp/PilA